MTIELKFVAELPPAPRRGGPSWAVMAHGIAAELDKRPGQWAEVKRYKGTNPYAARKSLAAALGPAYRVETRRVGEQSVLYAKSVKAVTS